MYQGSGTVHRGFTLIEMMLVMAIIALIATSVMFTLPSSSPSLRSPNDIAVTLQQQLQYAREYAMVRQQPLGLQMQPQGYQFVAWGDNQWQPLQARGLKPNHFDDDVRWDLQPLAGNLVQQDQQRDPLFQPEENDDNEAEQLIPQVMVLPSGEMTAFKLQLRRLSSAEEQWLVALTPWDISIQGGPDVTP